MSSCVSPSILADACAFKWIRDALDKADLATGTSVPVLVVADSGGCAEDIYNYVLGPTEQWLASDAERQAFLPTEGKGRDAEYVREALKWLPEIAALCADTGQNDTRQLSFFKLSEDGALIHKEDLAIVIQHALLNDCPNVSQEALLAVSWGEPSILQQQLDTHSDKSARMLHPPPCGPRPAHAFQTTREQNQAPLLLRHARSRTLLPCLQFCRRRSWPRPRAGSTRPTCCSWRSRGRTPQS